jgi:hypothetical protein
MLITHRMLFPTKTAKKLLYEKTPFMAFFNHINLMFSTTLDRRDS